MRLATRHHCRFRHHDEFSWRCYEGGDGKPKRKACPRDGADWIVEQGLWGVFVWNEDRRYLVANAVVTRLSETAAKRYIDQHPDLGYVSRWIPASELEATP